MADMFAVSLEKH